jgi:hypothetical protein
MHTVAIRGGVDQIFAKIPKRLMLFGYKTTNSRGYTFLAFIAFLLTFFENMSEGSYAPLTLRVPPSLCL